MENYPEIIPLPVNFWNTAAYVFFFFQMTNDALMTLHQIYQHLLSLLPRCRLYVDPQTHGTTKLMVYFAVLQYCLISKHEKLMVGIMIYIGSKPITAF